MRINKFQRVDADNLDELVDAGAQLIRKEWFGIWEWRRNLPREILQVVDHSTTSIVQ